MNEAFGMRLAAEVERKASACAVGLDPNWDLMPKWLVEAYRDSPCDGFLAYNKLVIDAVYDLVPVVKPQSAFYEAYGVGGINVLELTIKYARERGLIVLLDAKRGDIGSTSTAYAKAYLDGVNSGLKVDSMTLIPYLGKDAMDPFCREAIKQDAGLFVCAMTSNAGAVDFQKLCAAGLPIYLHVANLIRTLQVEFEPTAKYKSIGIVAGATYPDEAKLLREALPMTWFLVPGMGAQGGNAQALRAYFDDEGLGAIASSSRTIMYPEGASNAASSSELIRRETEAFIYEVNSARHR